MLSLSTTLGQISRSITSNCNALRGFIGCQSNILSRVHNERQYEQTSSIHTTLSNEKYTDWRMVRDVKRRRLVKRYAKERMNINAIRKNDILPKEIQVEADKEINEHPVDARIVRVRGRCVITSRPRGVLRRWRLSRIVWRHLADYNYLSGVQRAMW